MADNLNFYENENQQELTPEEKALHNLYLEMMAKGYQEMASINKQLANNETPENGIW